MESDDGVEAAMGCLKIVCRWLATLLLDDDVFFLLLLLRFFSLAVSMRRNSEASSGSNEHCNETPSA
jgi:hypothetical protein